MDGPRVVCRNLRATLHESAVRIRFETCLRRSALQFTKMPKQVKQSHRNCPSGQPPALLLH
jgi:hypothetical protein